MAVPVVVTPKLVTPKLARRKNQSTRIATVPILLGSLKLDVQHPDLELA